jgi:hypothetical protein
LLNTLLKSLGISLACRTQQQLSPYASAWLN